MGTACVQRTVRPPSVKGLNLGLRGGGGVKPQFHPHPLPSGLKRQEARKGLGGARDKRQIKQGKKTHCGVNVLSSPVRDCEGGGGGNSLGDAKYPRNESWPEAPLWGGRGPK